MNVKKYINVTENQNKKTTELITAVKELSMLMPTMATSINTLSDNNDASLATINETISSFSDSIKGMFESLEKAFGGLESTMKTFKIPVQTIPQLIPPSVNPSEEEREEKEKKKDHETKKNNIFFGMFKYHTLALFSTISETIASDIKSILGDVHTYFIQPIMDITKKSWNFFKEKMGMKKKSPEVTILTEIRDLFRSWMNHEAYMEGQNSLNKGGFQTAVEMFAFATGIFVGALEGASSRLFKGLHFRGGRTSVSSSENPTLLRDRTTPTQGKLSKYMEGIGKSWGKMGKLMSKEYEFTKLFLEMSFPKVSGIMKNLRDRIVMIPEYFKYYGDIAKEKFFKLVEPIVGIFKSMSSGVKLGEKATKILSWIKSPFGIGKTVGKWLGVIAEPIYAAYSFYSRLKEAFSFKSGLGIGDRISNFIQDLGMDFTSWFAMPLEIAQWITEKILGLFSIKNKLHIDFSSGGLRKIFNSMGEWIGRHIPFFIYRIFDGIGNLWDKTLSGFKYMGKVGSSILDSIVKWFKEFFTIDNFTRMFGGTPKSIELPKFDDPSRPKNVPVTSGAKTFGQVVLENTMDLSPVKALRETTEVLEKSAKAMSMSYNALSANSNSSSQTIVNSPSTTVNNQPASMDSGMGNKVNNANEGR